MTPFQFGQILGSEKFANALVPVAKPLVGQLMRQPAIRIGSSPQTAQSAMRFAAPMLGAAVLGSQGLQAAGAAHGAMTAPEGHGFEGALRGAVKAPTQALGGALGAAAGGVVGLNNAGFRGVNSVARGIDSGMGAGTRVMDSVLGGKATGIGGKILRAPAQAVGGAVGAGLGAVRAPFSALGGVAHDIYQGARKGVNLGGRMQEALLPAPSYANKLPTKAAFAPQPMAPPPGAMTTVGTKVPRQGGINGGVANQKINLGAGRDMLSQGLGKLQSGLDAMKKLNRPNSVSQI